MEIAHTTRTAVSHELAGRGDRIGQGLSDRPIELDRILTLCEVPTPDKPLGRPGDFVRVRYSLCSDCERPKSNLRYDWKWGKMKQGVNFNMRWGWATKVMVGFAEVRLEVR